MKPYRNKYSICIRSEKAFSGTTDILLLIVRSRLSITQASSSFKRLDMRTFMYATPTFITEALSCYASTAAFNNCYSEVTPYTVLANS